MASPKFVRTSPPILILRLLAVCFLPGALTARAAAPEVQLPPLLKKVLVDTSRAADSWAYTETTVIKGAEKRGRKDPDKTTIIRFDPSKLYAEQFVPVELNGHAPTTKDLKRYREMGEKRGKMLEKESPKAIPDDSVSMDQMNSTALSKVIDVARITTVADTSSSITYDVPLRKGAEVQGLPVDKFNLVVRIDKERQAVTNITFRTAQTRILLAINIKSAEFSIDFTAVDPKLAPAFLRMVGTGSYSVFGKKNQLDLEVTHSELKHVVPFGNRFGVKIGPLQLMP